MAERVGLYRSYFYPSRQARLAFAGTLLTGVVYSIPLAFVVRSRRRPADAPASQ